MITAAANSGDRPTCESAEAVRLESTRHWNQLDSRCEVESMRNSKMTSADMIAIVTTLTSCLEARIERHTAVYEERRPLDVIRLIARQPYGSAPDLFRFADAFVRN